MFLDKLSEVSKHEQYSKASKHPHIRPGQPSELLLDHEFCRLFKALEGLVGKSVSLKNDLLNGDEVPDSVLVHQYKELIRNQDNRLQELEKEVDKLRSQERLSSEMIENMRVSLAQLKDENVLLRAHASSSGTDFRVNQMLEQIEYYKKEVEQWKEKCMKAAECRINEDLTESTGQIGDKLETLGINSSEADQLRNQLAEALEKLSKMEEMESELEKLRKDQEDYLELLNDQDTKLNEYREKLKQLGVKVEDEEEEEEEEEASFVAQ